MTGRVALVAALVVACGRIGFTALAGDGGGGGGDGGGGGSDGAAGGDGAPPGGEANLVFVTSTGLRAGELGSLAGADDLCKASADAVGLAGTYVAFLSSSTENARDRLGGASGWVRVDGAPVAANLAELAAGRMLFPIALDEKGTEVGGLATVNTASTADGVLTGGTCADFTTFGGTLLGGQASWTGIGFTAPAYGIPCNVAVRYYCFGVDRAASVTIQPASGRRAFLTDGTWTPGGGRASADALCAAEAETAGLNGTFLAFLATTTETAASRFDLGGAPWVRLDGLLLAPTAADLVNVGPAAPLNVTPTLAYLASEDARAFGGGLSPTELAPTADASCSDWTTTIGTRVAQVGRPVASRLAFFRDDLDDCYAALPIYCLEP